MRKNVVFFCPANGAKESPAAMTFLKSFAEVHSATRNPATNKTLLKTLSARRPAIRYNPTGRSTTEGDIVYAVFMVPDDSRTKGRDSRDCHAHKIGRGVHDGIVTALGHDIPCLIIHKNDEGYFRLRKIEQLDKIPSPYGPGYDPNYAEYAWLMVNRAECGPTEFFDYPTNQQFEEYKGKRGGELEEEGIYDSVFARSTARQINRAVDPTCEFEESHKRKMDSAPKPVRLTNAAVYWYRQSH